MNRMSYHWKQTSLQICYEWGKIGRAPSDNRGRPVGVCWVPLDVWPTQLCLFLPLLSSINLRLNTRLFECILDSELEIDVRVRNQPLRSMSIGVHQNLTIRVQIPFWVQSDSQNNEKLIKLESYRTHQKTDWARQSYPHRNPIVINQIFRPGQSPIRLWQSFYYHSKKLVKSDQLITFLDSSVGVRKFQRMRHEQIIDKSNRTSNDSNRMMGVWRCLIVLGKMFKRKPWHFSSAESYSVQSNWLRCDTDFNI